MSNQVNANVNDPTSVYTFYQAAMDAISRKKDSAVIKLKLGTHNVLVSSTATSRKSTLKTSWEEFSASLIQTFGKEAAAKGLAALEEQNAAAGKKAYHPLSARSIAVVVATAQEAFDSDKLRSVTQRVVDVGKDGWCAVEHHGNVGTRCSRAVDTLMLQLFPDVSRDGKTSVEACCQKIAENSGVKPQKGFDGTKRESVRMYLTNVLMWSHNPEIRRLLTGERLQEKEGDIVKSMPESVGKTLRKTADKIRTAKANANVAYGLDGDFVAYCKEWSFLHPTSKVMTVQGKPVADNREFKPENFDLDAGMQWESNPFDCSPENQQLFAAVQDLIPADFPNREKFLLFATSLCGAKGPAQQANPNGWPTALDLSVVKDDDGNPRQLIVTLKHEPQDDFDFFGVKSPHAGEDDKPEIGLPLGEVVTTVSIDLDKPLGENGLPNYECKTECLV